MTSVIILQKNKDHVLVKQAQVHCPRQVATRHESLAFYNYVSN